MEHSLLTWAMPCAMLHCYIGNIMPIEQNKHLIQAMTEYRDAMRMVKNGMLGNAQAQRDRLRFIYRLIAGK